jgi:G3E family GTPase
MKTVSFHMIGGFLGAGKTTAIRKYVEWLWKTKGLKTAVITNDQAEDLVDSDLMEDAGIAGEEIAGGCFCCRSDLLMETADRLINDFDPDVIVAEPVGSCMDLMATVSLPISVFYQRPFDIGPLTVLVDPFRGEQVLRRSANGKTDPNDLDYIYLKQLEEAQVIVVNKKELLSEARLATLKRNLNALHPGTPVFVVSARKEEGLDEWWEYLHSVRAKPSCIMDVDYARYAEGEAKLGWVNASYQFFSSKAIDFNKIGRVIVAHIVSQFSQRCISIGHFKLRIAEEGQPNSAAVIQWVDNEREPEFTSNASGLFTDGQITVNLRAESEPGQLGEMVHEAVSLGCAGGKLVRERIAAFAPAPPNPVHRVSSLLNGTDAA